MFILLYIENSQDTLNKYLQLIYYTCFVHSFSLGRESNWLPPAQMDLRPLRTQWLFTEVFIIICSFQKDKLKHDAVPTEDGPFCTTDSSQAIVFIENDIPGIPINVDDIENEKLDSVEKKAHRSVKYGDFLISDATELFNASIDSQATDKNMFLSSRKTELYKDQQDHKSKNEDNHKYTINYVNEENTQQKSKTTNKNTPITRIVSIGFDEPTKTKNKNLLLKTPTKNLLNSNLAAAERSSMNPRVQIISQKTLSEPVLVEGKLEPVSPSMIIQNPRRQKRNVAQNDIKPTVIQQELKEIQANGEPKHPEVVFDNILPIEYVPTASESDVVNTSSLASSTVQHANMIQYDPPLPLNLKSINKNNKSNNDPLDISQMPIEIFLDDIPGPAPGAADAPYNLTQKPILTPTSTPVYKSLLKSKITPEKMAAIEQKRKFNLKMKDVITSCLDNMEEPNDEIIKKITELKKQSKQSLIMEQNKKRSLLKEHSSVANQDIIPFLDQRLEKLENTLLNKIIHNTQRINELKRVMKPSVRTRNANTQTYLSDLCDESQKHFLYKEISKFLTPDACIKIFQELFLTNNDDETHIPTPRKLRRRR